MQKFMDWFESAPFYLTVFALPIVAIIYLVAVIKNNYRRPKTK